MTKLWWAIIAQFIGSIIAFYQLQGWIAYEYKFLKSIWWVYFTSIFIAPLFFWSTIWSYEYFGFTWNIRLIGFGLGTIVFGILSWSLLDEIPTLKTIICLLLAASIVLIQVTNVLGK